MRILLTTDTVGGVWTFTQDLTEELLEQGHAVALASLGREPSLAQKTWATGMVAACSDRFVYQPSQFPLEWQQENVRAYDAAAPWLLELVRAFAPDLIHSNQFAFGRLPAGVPVVLTAHSDVVSWGEACRQPHGLEPSPWLDRYMALVAAGLASAASISAPTKWMLEVLRCTFKISTATAVIHNGRPPQQPVSSQRKLQAVSAGRLWDEAKNIALLTRLRSPMPILVAGEAEHDGAQAPGAAGQVRFLGPLAQSDLFQLFSKSSVYVSPARYEPFGLAVLEAAQCGCALLLNDLPSFRELWGEAALYFRDEMTLEVRLQELAAKPELLAEARAKAQERATQFSASRMADEYLRLYEEALAAYAEVAHAA